jgi:SAM-dependent methyltransferase/Tfp pilus assembly protein PilF
MNRGAQALEAGQLNDAIELFNQAQALLPEYPDAPAMLGVALFMQGELARAEAMLLRAVELAPARPEFLQNLGLVLGAQGRLEAEAKIYEQALKLEPNNPPLLELLGQVLLKLGRAADAWAAFGDLLTYQPDNRIARHNIAHALRESPMVVYRADHDALLVRLLGFDNTEHLYLAPSVANLLFAKHRLAESYEPPLDALARDTLLLNALAVLYFMDPRMERFLVRTRARVLEALADPAVDAAVVGLGAMLAVHGFVTDHAQASTPAEDATVATHGATITELAPAGVVTAALGRALVAYAMYAPLGAHPAADALTAIPMDRWPPGLHMLVHRSLQEPRDELVRAARIPSFGRVSDPTSADVQAMYEQHPYPRWLSMGWVAPLPLGIILEQNLPEFRAPAWADGRPFEVLIAGCGTGRHALRAATHYTGARVLAVDITRRSLGYAQRKAAQMGLRNIEFLHCDLHELPALGRRFQLIETIGSFETLDDPGKGWAALRACLADDGILHVGAYSELSRQPVVRARERIAALGLDGSPASMRAFRQLVLDGLLGEDGEQLMAIGDFYSLAGVRDFLFHVKENRFTLRQLQGYLDGNGLEFLGLHPMRREFRELLRERAPEASGARLADWIALEDEVPERVTQAMQLGMYFLWSRVRR